MPQPMLCIIGIALNLKAEALYCIQNDRGGARPGGPGIRSGPPRPNLNRPGGSDHDSTGLTSSRSESESPSLIPTASHSSPHIMIRVRDRVQAPWARPAVRSLVARASRAAGPVRRNPSPESPPAVSRHVPRVPCRAHVPSRARIRVPDPRAEAGARALSQAATPRPSPRHWPGRPGGRGSDP
jgi:hypothetical protein